LVDAASAQLGQALNDDASSTFIGSSGATAESEDEDGSAQASS